MIGRDQEIEKDQGKDIIEIEVQDIEDIQDPHPQEIEIIEEAVADMMIEDIVVILEEEEMVVAHILEKDMMRI